MMSQKYEKYWSYTAEFTDLFGENAVSLLRICTTFLDKHKMLPFSRKYYGELQREIRSKLTNKINLISVRKAINQFVKLGFLKPLLQGYVEETKDFIDAKTEERRGTILSKVVYKYSNFNNSMTRAATLGRGQIHFLLKTLDEVGSIDDNNLKALMTVDVDAFPKGYLNRKELRIVYTRAVQSGFVKRKYNQISHLKNLLSRLDDLQVEGKVICFKTEIQELLHNWELKKKKGRDMYRQRMYKSELEKESREQYNSTEPKCMSEGQCFPFMMASHIKPYHRCNEAEQFDAQNGLLLSKNLDSLFDWGYISFDDDGSILPSQCLGKEMVKYLTQFRLNELFINPQRMKFMEYHRKNIFEKRFKTLKKYRTNAKE